MSLIEVQTLSADSDMPLLCLFSPLLSLEQVLSVPTIEPLVSLAKLEVVTIVVFVSLDCFALEPMVPALIALSISLSLSIVSV